MVQKVSDKKTAAGKDTSEGDGQGGVALPLQMEGLWVSLLTTLAAPGADPYPPAPAAF